MNSKKCKLKPIESFVLSIIHCNRFISYAILLTFLFGCVHLLGFREYTGILSGTISISKVHQAFGMIYIILYFCFVFIVPILLIAKLFLVIFKKMKIY